MEDTNEIPFKLPFLKKEQLNKDTYCFYFKRTGDERDFVAGQFYEMKLNIKNPDERGDTHVFTCSSSPTEKDYLMFTTRIIESTFKKALFELREGDIVQFNGPWDDINFDESETASQVFLAGGIGITPFHSITKYMMDKNLEMPVTFFVSWKTKEDMIWDDFFKNAENTLPDFKYVPTLTEEKDVGSWSREIGRIDPLMINKYVEDVKGSRYRIAGPPAMVNALKETVENLGVPKENIIAEEFEGY